MQQQKSIEVVILAAGKGTRMKLTDRPKVMAEVLRKPLVQYVVEQALAISPNKITVVVGFMREVVERFLLEKFDNTVETVIQAEQLGTGHAVVQAEAALGSGEAEVLILSGDVPLLRASTIRRFRDLHADSGADVSVLSVVLDNATGYGRIVRSQAGDFTSIVEEKDATAEQKEICEINSGIYLVDKNKLFAALQQLSNSNAQGEYYLTDIIAIIKNEGGVVRAFSCAEPAEVQGINTLEQLAEVEKFLQDNPQYLHTS